VSFTFQTLDRDGMMLNMAQTWHQVRPGEVRTNCGGCHAHSQQPTLFEKTAAAKPDYAVFDLSKSTPLLTSKKLDESSKQWDVKNETGLKFGKGVKDVEYWRDVRPIFERSCVACHSMRNEKPPAGLVLDDDRAVATKNHMGPRNAPGTYLTLAASEGHGPLASRYVARMQSRCSPLIWKVFGRRTDGLSNDQPAVEKKPAINFRGNAMPPPEAVKSGKVKPLSEEDRLTLVRWIDLGCPIDLTYDPAKPQAAGSGFFADRTLPALTVAIPQPGENREPLRRLLIGMHDQYSGLDMESFRVVADFVIAGVEPGQDLAAKFRQTNQGVWELQLEKPIAGLAKGKVTVSVQDRQGNRSRVERTFSVK
jgi:hypothetical protein